MVSSCRCACCTPVLVMLGRRSHLLLRCAELDEESGEYIWRPSGLRVFETESFEPDSDVSAVRDGHVSVTPLRTAFLGP